MNINDRVSITLTAGEWNNVMALLAEQPFKVSAPLINQIQQQAMMSTQGAQMDDQPLPGDQPVPPRANGMFPSN